MCTCARARVRFRRPFSQPRRKGDFPLGVMPQVGFPCVGVFDILEIEPQGGFPFVGVVRGELARGISLCECEKCVKVCKF